MKDEEGPKVVVRYTKGRAGQQRQWPVGKDGVHYQERRVVQLDVRTFHDRGGMERVWGYSVADLRRLLGYSSDTMMRKAITAGRVDPGDLMSVCMHWYERMRSETVSKYDVVSKGQRYRFELSYEPGDEE